MSIRGRGGAAFPQAYRLEQNRPNPFNASTSISCDLPHGGPVTIDVYNILGQQVKRLVEATKAAGRYRVDWDGTDAAGKASPSGIYFYRLRTTAGDDVRKMALLK